MAAVNVVGIRESAWVCSAPARVLSYVLTLAVVAVKLGALCDWIPHTNTHTTASQPPCARIARSPPTQANNIIVGIKVSVLIIFIAAGSAYVNTANWTPFVPEATAPGTFGPLGIFRGAAVVFFRCA